MTNRWAKADRRRVLDAIDGYRMMAGGIDASSRTVYADLKEGTEAEAAARYLDFLAERAHDRAAKNRDTAEHARAHPAIWGSATDEIVERFTRLTADEARKAKMYYALAVRLRTEGMPPPLEAL